MSEDQQHRLVLPQGTRIRDFGAARQAIGAKSRSVTSIVTPGYAPIEQYSSRGRRCMGAMILGLLSC